MKCYFSSFSPRFAARPTTSPHDLSFVFLCFLLMTVVGLCGVPRAGAALRPGAPRSLRLSGSDPQRNGVTWRSDAADGTAPATSPMALSQPAFAPRAENGTLPFFFTRSADGTRNIWRAALPIENKTTNAIGDDAARPVPSSRETRNAVLQAVPVTQLIAPYFADSAVPTPDGRALLCVTNIEEDAATATAGHTAIARLDLRSGRMVTLIPGDAQNSSPRIAPDGRHFVFVSNSGGIESIYMTPIGGGDARRVVAFAHNPFWLDETTLIYESTRPGAVGLYRLSLDGANPSRNKPQMLWQRGGQGVTAPNGRLLCVSAQRPVAASGPAASPATTRLYTLAADGSGARAVVGSEGAGAANFAFDSSVALFDAPVGEGVAETPQSGRTLWLLPIVHVPPIANISEARAAGPGSPALEIWGTIFSGSESPARARLEWTENAGGTENGGSEPRDLDHRRWSAIALERTPANNSRLALWMPPAARGDWLVRLVVTDADGDSSQSLLPLTLPLEEAPQTLVNPPVFSSLPLLVSPAAPAPEAMEPKNPRDGLSTVPTLPLPALPPAPPPPAAAGKPVPALPPAPPVRYANPTPQAQPMPRASARRTPKPAPKPRVRRTPRPVEALPGDAAVVTVSGVPLSMSVGEEAPLVATLRNTGSNGWKVDGDAPVRVLIRWHDLATGTRTRWAVRWLRADVPPGGTAKVPLTLAAPPRPGHYALKFSLVRAGKDGYEAPEITSMTMPGEFGVASTTMDVK